MGDVKFWREMFLPLTLILCGISDSLGAPNAKVLEVCKKLRLATAKKIYIFDLIISNAIKNYLPSSLPLAVPGYTASFLIRPDLIVSYSGLSILLASNSKFTDMVPFLVTLIF